MSNPAAKNVATNSRSFITGIDFESRFTLIISVEKPFKKISTHVLMIDPAERIAIIHRVSFTSNVGK